MSSHDLQPGSISIWLEPLRAGSDEAAQQLWERYFTRLVTLAKARLRAPSRVTDEEDVVVTAFDSFYRGAREGRFPQLADRDDLWQVLVMLTVRKASNQRAHWARKKRGGGRVRGESVFGELDHAGTPQGVARVADDAPTPEFVAQLTEQFGQLLARLNDHVLSLVAFYKFEGRTNSEIAQALDCSVASVERKLRLIRQCWEQK